MALNIAKGEKHTINLSKDTNSLLQVSVGLGWDMARGAASIDLDASAVLCSGKNITDIVYFGQKQSKDCSIIHSGDNLTGEGDGDDETIVFKLSKIPESVDNIFITINSYRGQTFDTVENAHCNVYDDSNKQKIFAYNLSASKPYTALIVGRLRREKTGNWSFKAIGDFCNGKTAKDLTSDILALL